MSQTSSFLTDTLFPGLLIGCGCLGLAVVNFLGHQPTIPRKERSQPSQVRSTQAQPDVNAPDRARPVAVRVSGVQGQRGPSAPRVASLRRRPRPTVHHLAFAKERTQVTDAERERLRIFLAAAKPGSDSRVTVVGHGVGRRGRRRARKRTEQVVAILKQLGVVGAIAESKVTSDDGAAGGQAVTVVIRKR